MRVQVSKTLTAWLNKKFKQHNIPYKAIYTAMTRRDYDILVGDTTMDTLEYDYDFFTQQYKVIKILYPDNYYACPQYLTTTLLLKLARNIHGDANLFYKNIFNEIAI